MNPSKEGLELRRDFEGADFEKTELFISVWLLALFRVGIGNKNMLHNGTKEKKSKRNLIYIISFNLMWQYN